MSIIYKDVCNFNEGNNIDLEHIEKNLHQIMINYQLAASLFNYPIGYVVDFKISTELNKFDSDDKCWDCTFPSSNDEQYSKLKYLIEEIERFTFDIDYRNNSTTELTCEVTPTKEGKVLVNINIRYTA